MVKNPAVFIIGIAMLIWCGRPGGVKAADRTGLVEDAPALAIAAPDVARLALENSPDIQMLKFDAARIRTGLSEQESIFDIVLRGGISYGDDQTKQSSPAFGTRSREQSLDVALEKKLLTGTDITVSAGDIRASTNSSFASVNPAHEATVGISLRQPLGNNTLGLIDRGNIALAQLNVESLGQQVMADIENVVAGALEAYWKLVLAWEEGAIDAAMLAKARELSRAAREKKALGLVEDAELLATLANVKQRETGLRNQQHSRTRAKYALFRALFEDDLAQEVRPADKLEVLGRDVSLAESLQRAIAGRRDYAQAKNSADAQRLNLKMKENARWPEIDLEASLRRNGLDSAPAHAWQQVSEEDNAAWRVGLRVSVPLENRKARAQAEQARYDREKALVALKKVEHGIVVDVATAIDALRNARETAALQEEVVRLQEEKLAAEEKRFRAGRSDTDLVIRYQEDVLEARRSLARARYDWQIAMIKVKVAEQTLLSEYWAEATAGNTPAKNPKDNREAD